MVLKILPALFLLKKNRYGILFLLGLMYLIQKPTVFYPDSYGYLKMELQRSMGYPLFLAFCRMLLGSHYLTAVIVLQYCFNFFAAKHLVGAIEKTLKMNRWLSLLLFLVLMHPVFKGMKLAQLLLSEALAYPLYLTTFGYLLLGIRFKESKCFYWAIGFTFVNLLVRGQFLFLVPLIVLALFFTYNDQWRQSKALALLAVTLSLPILATLTDIGYHKIKHGYAVSTPWTGIQVITLPFFVSDKNDVAVFKDPKQKEYFEHIYQKLDEKHLLLSQLSRTVKPMDFYYDQYIYICNRTIHKNGIEMFPNADSEEEKIIANNQMTLSMTWPLLWNNFPKWKKMYLENFITGFDTSKYFLLSVFLLVLGLYAWWKQQDFVGVFVILALAATILNVALVAAAEAIIQRYTFYNNWVLIAIVFILFQNQFKQKNHA